MGKFPQIERKISVQQIQAPEMAMLSLPRNKMLTYLFHCFSTYIQTEILKCILTYILIYLGYQNFDLASCVHVKKYSQQNGEYKSNKRVRAVKIRNYIWTGSEFILCEICKCIPSPKLILTWQMRGCKISFH